MGIEDWIDAASRGASRDVFLEPARGGQPVTFGDLGLVSERFERRLGRLGIGRGERVLVAPGDPVAYAAALVATVAAGRVAVPCDPALPAGELARTAEVAGARVGVLGRSGVRSLHPTRLDFPVGGREGLDDELDAEPARGGLLLVTSGTTGRPKGVLLEEAQLAHVAGTVAAHHRLGPGDRGLNPLPLHHVNAPVVAVLASLAAGATVVLDDRFHRTGFSALVRSTRATWVNAVPAILAIVASDLAEAEPRGVLGAGRLRFVRSASAPLGPSVLRRFEACAGVGVLETYGMTEAASMIAANPLDGPRKAGSVGRPVGVELRVADEAHRALPAGRTGTVEVRGPGVVRRYAFGNAPGQFAPDGWLVTGDLGRLDQEGYLVLDGRADDLIIRGGENVMPAEVETVLLAHPLVGAAAVVGKPDPVLGAVPVAYVVPARPLGPGGRARLVAELAESCRSSLSRSKVPVEITLTERLPVGPTGKVRRSVLARALAEAS